MDYKIKTAGKSEILHHLNECNKNYIPHLSERVNITEYSIKIADNAFTFEAWDKAKLVGLVAVYLNSKSLTAFVTNVSVLKDYWGSGMAKQLMKNCIEYLKKNNFEKVQLEVDKNNINAVNLYKRLNFIRYDVRAETELMELAIK